MSICISQLSEGHVFGPLDPDPHDAGRADRRVRAGDAVRLAGRPTAHPGDAGVGVLDMAGNGLFILAVQTGALAVAAVLSSLYPVTTVILATVVPGERITRSHAVGIALAARRSRCIAAGSAAEAQPRRRTIVTASTSVGSRRTTTWPKPSPSRGVGRPSIVTRGARDGGGRSLGHDPGRASRIPSEDERWREVEDHGCRRKRGAGGASHEGSPGAGSMLVASTTVSCPAAIAA
jgi:hypothetical protein